MAKYNRNAKARRNRRWLKNVGDPIDLKRKGASNPNDQPKYDPARDKELR